MTLKTIILYGLSAALLAAHGQDSDCKSLSAPDNTQWTLGRLAAYRIDFPHPFSDYETQAVSGDPRALARLGEVYENGWGVKADPEKACEYYQRAAQAGDAVGMYLLARRYGFAEEHRQAKNWYGKALPALEAAADGEDSEAQYWLSKLYASGAIADPDYAQAISWLRKAAEREHAQAQLELAKIYADGQFGGEDADAIDWYRKAAAHGKAEAMLSLGDIYKRGRGIETNAQKAATWYQKGITALEKAAAQGALAAQFQLGRRYRDGYGVEEDPAKARYWLEKAAEQGFVPAQNTLKRLPAR